MATLGAPGAEEVTILLPYSLKYSKQLRMTIWQKLKDLWFCRALSRMIMKTTSPVTLNNLLPSCVVGHHGWIYHVQFTAVARLSKKYYFPFMWLENKLFAPYLASYLVLYCINMAQNSHFLFH